MTRPDIPVVLLCLAVASPAVAETPRLDPIERIELSAHARLARVREAAQLNAFTTDGCSGGLSALWHSVAELFPAFAEVHEEAPPWEGCCVAHDRAYHLGGPSSDPMDSFQARLAADEGLRACVLDTRAERGEELAAQYGMTAGQVDLAYTAIAGAMFDAVRLGGAPCSGLSWRWGYGWPACGILAAPE